MALRDDFENILSTYLPSKNSGNMSDVNNIFKSLKSKMENLSCVKKNKALLVKFRYGIGGIAQVPWIAILDKTETTRMGVYVVYLFKADMTGVYLTFNQGVGASDRKVPTKDEVLNLQKRAQNIRIKMQWLAQKGFLLDQNISLNASSIIGKTYEKSTMAYKLYTKGNIPTDDKLESDLCILLEAYDDYLKSKTGASTPQIDNQTVHVEENKLGYTVELFSEETGFSVEIIKTWENMLKRKKHLIFQGPPGTGKTFVAQRLAKLLTSGNNGIIKTVQFYPDYSYEDFIQGYFPDPEGGTFKFKLQKGVFLRFCDEARKILAPCVMIIDEINRANLSRVFGELMYLLEYRDDKIPLATGSDLFYIPHNVYIIGTMNTADRSIALVDHALRRRFCFVRLKPEYEILEKHLKKYNLPAESLVSVLKEINSVIDDPNYEIGISFFMKDKVHLKE